MSTQLFLLLLALALYGCRPGDSPPTTQRPAVPGPGDSLAKLARRLLEDPDPVAIAQAIICENRRLIKVYGPRKANDIAREVEDTIYTWRDQAARRRVDAKFANRVFRSECAPVTSEAPKAMSPR